MAISQLLVVLQYNITHDPALSSIQYSMEKRYLPSKSSAAVQAEFSGAVEEKGKAKPSDAWIEGGHGRS